MDTKALTLLWAKVNIYFVQNMMMRISQMDRMRRIVGLEKIIIARVSFVSLKLTAKSFG